MRRNGRLVGEVDKLQGSRLSFPGTLHCLMGECAVVGNSSIDVSVEDASFLARRRHLRERHNDDNVVDIKHRQECFDDFLGCCPQPHPTPTTAFTYP